MHRREDVQTAKRKYKMANMYDGEEVPIMEDEEVPITEDKEVPITEDKEVPIMEDDEWDMILGWANVRRCAPHGLLVGGCTRR